MKFDKSWIRWTVMKFLGLVLALVFFALALLSLGYPAVSALANLNGTDAKVIEVKSACPAHPLIFKKGGFYALTAAVDKQKFDKLYVPYPQWPGHFAPQKGTWLKFWPPDHPHFASGGHRRLGLAHPGVDFNLGVFDA